MKDLEVLRANVVLKSGKMLEVMVSSSRKFNSESLTEKVLHSFVNADSSIQYFVQGINIDYVEVIQDEVV